MGKFTWNYFEAFPDLYSVFISGAFVIRKYKVLLFEVIFLDAPRQIWDENKKTKKHIKYVS